MISMKAIFIILFVAISISSCRSTKEIKKVIQPKDKALVVSNKSVEDSIAYSKDIINSFRSNYINFNTFSAKIKAEVEDKNGKQPDLSVVVRIQRDSAIWIRVD